jgi:cytochrome c5
MSANGLNTSNATAQTEPSSPGGIKGGVMAFVVPVLVLIAAAVVLTPSKKLPADTAIAEREVAARIQKVGAVEVRAANRELRTGEEVYKAQCATCHGTGALGSPKFQDAAAWGPRIGAGFDALLNSALKGKNSMTPQGGGEFSDYEVARAVVYMANAGGAKFAEPKAPAAPADAAAK